MTVKEVIKQLQEIEKKFGNLPVMGSADEEQNVLGDIFQIQCGKLTEYDTYNGDNAKQGDMVVVLVPAI